tara:strand:- start:2307 stop:2609 length:303 start_codon:yes stop_codon:yes gene_type:complete
VESSSQPLPPTQWSFLRESPGSGDATGFFARLIQPLLLLRGVAAAQAQSKKVEVHPLGVEVATKTELPVSIPLKISRLKPSSQPPTPAQPKRYLGAKKGR